MVTEGHFLDMVCHITLFFLKVQLNYKRKYFGKISTHKGKANDYNLTCS